MEWEDGKGTVPDCHVNPGYSVWTGFPGSRFYGFWNVSGTDDIKLKMGHTMNDEIECASILPISNIL